MKQNPKDIQVQLIVNNQWPDSLTVLKLKKGLYNQIRKIVQKQEIIVSIDGKICAEDEKIEKHHFDQVPLTLLRIQVFDQQWLIDYVRDNDDFKQAFIQLKKIFEMQADQILYNSELFKKEKNELLTKIEELQQTNQILSQNIEDLEKQLNRSKPEQSQRYISELEKSSFGTVCDSTVFTQQVQYYNDVLKSKYERKFNRFSTQSSSIITTQLAQCHFCQQSKHDNFILLSCSHSYHQECLENLIEAQLTDKQPRLKCLCNNKISQQTLNQLDQLFAGKSLLELNFIQLEEIKKNNKYKFVKCRNRLCHFFYIQTGQFNNYCPLCLQ